MELRVKGKRQVFVPIREFRRDHALPDDFSIQTFEPKVYPGAASLQHAGPALNSVREAVLDAVPQGSACAAWRLSL
ncbi:MAG: hypothetical protein GYB68_19070, partial [Chloroflexi bacterium]|nr:hypothetical protein [Chloroflexota bacterium]